MFTLLIFGNPKLDEELNTEGTYVLYPHKDALTVKELKPEELNSIKKIVALDCTWFQTTVKKFMHDSVLLTSDLIKALINTVSKYPVKYVKLEEYETTFWRPQHHSKKCLSTCEAIYYFFKEYDVAKNLLTNENYQYDGKYDNLLFYYVLQFKAIERAWNDPESMKSEKSEKDGNDQKGEKDEKEKKNENGNKNEKDEKAEKDGKDEERKVPE